MTHPSYTLHTDPSQSRLAKLEQSCFADAWSAGSYAALRRNPAVHAWVLAGPGVGDIALACFQLAADEAELYRIGTAPRQREAGWGGILLGHVIAYCRAMQVRRVTLEVRAGNKAAISFYEKAGFRHAALRREYYRDPNEDALLLTLSLEPPAI